VVLRGEESGREGSDMEGVESSPRHGRKGEEKGKRGGGWWRTQYKPMLVKSEAHRSAVEHQLPK